MDLLSKEFIFLYISFYGRFIELKNITLKCHIKLTEIDPTFILSKNLLKISI